MQPGSGARQKFDPGRFALAVAISIVGGLLFTWLTMPLPWLLGPMVLNTIAALSRAPVQGPVAIRPYVIVVIGVMLGSGFTPDLLDRLAVWGVSLGFAVVYLACAALITIPYYRLIGGFDPATSYFCAMPAGLSEMTVIGKAMGADDRRIALAHASRILIVVISLGVWFRLFSGLDLGDGISGGTSVRDTPSLELVKLSAVGVAGFFLGRRLRLPAPTLLGPMILSAGLYVSGIVSAPPPSELVLAAQLLLGTIIGCRFVGMSPRVVGGALIMGLGAAALLLGLTVLFAMVLMGVLQRDFLAILLAFAPGGLTEMSLIALAIGVDVGYVSSHHVVRVACVVAFAPLIFRLWRRFSGK
ncbi:AbrB family transcriptional regulator [Alkalilacustris brevis]|uniref:AbrB family transcriptional regulator n=1 Tax=Alkalilacustris brevis TaxID=2026338 RepID=UPI000E0D2FB3|nr:AbrB family transcriptional regulator [Alkalilacustris brevis]